VTSPQCLIRPLRRSDRQAVRSICAATAWMGSPADEHIHGLIDQLLLFTRKGHVLDSSLASPDLCMALEIDEEQMSGDIEDGRHSIVPRWYGCSHDQQRERNACQNGQIHASTP